MRFFCKIVLIMVARSFSSVSSSVRTVAAAAESRCTFRLATKKDISSISFCNIQTLPENYQDSYYEDHITKWPHLSLLAENENKKLIGYVLGKLEETQVESSVIQPWVVNYKPKLMHGHISSIAVSHNHRGKGIARELMKMLHSQLVNEHNIKSVTLHCRGSNLPAINLYVNSFKYRFVKELNQYYDDGER